RLGWYEGPTLLEILETAEVPQTLASAPFRFPVQYVARATAAQRRGYMGRIESGSIGVGDELKVLPSGRTTRVRELRSSAGSRSSAGLHAPVTLVLADDLDVARGDLIVRADDPLAERRSTNASAGGPGDGPLDPRHRYLMRHTPREVRARVDRIDHRWNVSTQERESAPAALAINDIGEIALSLAQPVFPDRYADNRATGSFILVDEASNGTVAAGMFQWAASATSSAPVPARPTS